MNAAEKEAWIADLQSGKYKHGKKRLKTIYHDNLVTEHCCLGVLCETLGKNILPVELDHGDEHRGVSNTDFNRVDVDGKVLGYEWFEKITGLTSGEVAVLYSINDAEETNDYRRQIDWIRENVTPK